MFLWFHPLKILQMVNSIAAVNLLVFPTILYFVFRPNNLISFAIIGALTWYSCRYIASGRTFTNLSRLSKKVIIVTGGNNGIGKETVKQLRSLGALVVIGCRDFEKGRAVAKELGNSSVYVFPLDLADSASIEQFVVHFKQLKQPLDILVNNAGIMMTPYGLTKDKFELQMGTNFMGHVYLTELLLPCLLDNPSGGRVVNVSSQAPIFFDPTDDGKTISWEKYLTCTASTYERHFAYGASKLANGMHARALQRRYGTAGGKDFLAVSLHPGCVLTDLWVHEVPSMTLYRLLRPLLPAFLQYPLEGIQTTLMCCVESEVLLVGGGFYDNCQLASRRTSHPLLWDDAECDRLYEWSLKVWADLGKRVPAK